jgi:hypothetical protein
LSQQASQNAGDVADYAAEIGMALAPFIGPASKAGKAVKAAAKIATRTVKEKVKNPGRTGRNARLRELADDPNTSAAHRGWIRHQINQKKSYLRNPPGTELAHRRGFEATKGYGYNKTDIRNTADHDIQHKFDNMGRLNKDRGKK